MNKAPKVLLAGLVVLGCSLSAQAAATISIYDGVDPLMSVSDNGPGDGDPTAGVIFVHTSLGVWNLDINVGTTKPALGSATAPAMDLEVFASSLAAGSLRVSLSDNGFGPSSGTLTAAFSGHITGGTAAVTQDYSVWGDPANVVGATTVKIADTGTTALPSLASGSGAMSLGAPFSLTQVEQINADGPTSISTDSSFQVVPEPGTLALGALGLAALAARKFGRK